LLKKSNARRPLGGGQENPTARGQKISLGCGAKGNFLPARF